MLVNKDLVNQRLYTSSVLKNIKDFFTDMFASVDRKTYKVQVTNHETKLYKEIAENTRGVKGKIIDLTKAVTDKKVNLSTIESKLDEIAKKDLSVSIGETKVDVDNVRVSNLSEIKIPQVIIPKEVRVSNLKDIVIPKPEKQEKVDFSSLESRLNALKSAFDKVSDYLPQLKPHAFPKIEFPKQISVKEADKIIDEYKKGVKILSDDLLALSKVIQAQETGFGTNDKGEVEVKVSNFPPTHIPTPVTNININSLRGIPKSTVMNVLTSATPIPATSLEQRRSVSFYNDSENTIYIGGSDVSSSNGFPIFPGTYSPPIEAGEHMKIYGVATSSSSIRVLEVSNDSEGN